MASTASSTQADTPHFSTDPAALYQTASQITPPAGADILNVEDQETITFDDEGKAIHSTYLLYKVLTQQGAKDWDSLSYSWEPWHEERPNLAARVITPDNVAHPLDPKTITEAAAKDDEDSVYSDRQTLRAPLPAIAPGSLVEEEETIKESAPFFGAGIVQRSYIGDAQPVHHTRLVVDAPAALALRYSVQLLPDLKPQRTESDGRVRLVFEHGPLDARDEVDSELPNDLPAYPNVTYSTGVSWQHVAETYSKIVDKQIKASDLKSLIGKLVAGKTSQAEQESAIVQYLDREIRYTGVEFGDASVIPRSPTETLARKYGDCKDKAALLVAMFRAAGIPAYVALLNAGSRLDVAPDLPGMGLFDHAIVYVPGNPDLWIDATDEYARLGQIPTSDQDRWALIARPETSSLLRTSVASSADNLLVEKREIYLAENGPARIVETSYPHGSVESSYRRSYADAQNKSAKDELTEYVKSQYLAEKLDRMDRSDPVDLTKQFELVLESKRAKRASTDLNSAVAAIRFDTLFSRLPSSLQQREKEDDAKPDSGKDEKPKKKRTADYQLPNAFVTEWRYDIMPPIGFQPKPLPQNSTISLGPAILKEEFSATKEGVVHAVIRFDTVKHRLTVTEATEMRNKIAELRSGQPILIYFEPVGQALLNAGKVGDALRAYHDLIALHPKEAVHHLQIAQTLLAAGLGEAARSEARAAVKLEPKSALAEKTLASILEYDLVGRKLRPGADFDGAAAAFRAASQLDPDDKFVVADWAIFLEYNHDGKRYEPGAKLSESIALYRSLGSEKLADLGLQNNLPFALFYAGEFAEAEKDAQTLNPPPTALIVACHAALHGAADAITEARRRNDNDEHFHDTAKTAGEMLMNVRKYSVAADLLDAGASGSNASHTAALASILRKAKLHEELAFADDPKGLVMQVFLMLTNPDLTLEKMLSITSRNGQIVTKAMEPEELEKSLHAGRTFRRTLGAGGPSPDVALDLFMSLVQPVVEGSDKTGYRVTLQVPGRSDMVMFAVKENGRYKLLDSMEKPNAIGLEILDQVDANNLEGARAFLDWLREAQHLAGGDDPLSGQPFPRFWTKGKDADTAHMKLAAAALLAQTKPTAAKGISILESAQVEALTAAEKENVALALLTGYASVEDYGKALPIAAQMAKEYPDSRRAFLDRQFYLRSLHRSPEADQLAEERLTRIHSDLDAMRALVFNAVSREDYGLARTLNQKILDTGKSEANDLNSMAWHSLFAGKVADADVDLALKATNLNQNNAATLHTLGCLYAEIGKTKEAREVLIQAMNLLALDEPNPDYWYAFGRIAEQYGERETAIADYIRVTKPKKPISIPDSTYHLAQTRLQSLVAAKPASESPVQN
jgi:transglutaminase-like putative cysteine protease/tetratricopeptide (TPR) repeat protein